MRLISNLSFVQLDLNGQPLRLSCHALLLEESMPLFDGERPDQIVRGFGPDAAWLTFTRWLDCNHLDYTIEEVTSRGFVMMSDSHPEGRPIFSGANLTFGDGTTMFLQAQDQEQPLDISDYDDYNTAWLELGEKARRYYTAPNFPVLTYVPRAFV